MRIHYGLVVVAATALTIGGASVAGAATFPYRLHQEQNIDSHQVGWIDLAIDAEGHGSLTQSWSNGKQTSGNTFYGIVALRAKDGTVLYTDKQTKGLDGSWGGHAREGHVTTAFTLNSERRAEFDHVDLKMGTMNCGMELTSVQFKDNGVDVGFSSKKCDVPKVPQSMMPRHQVF
jgi:hypothetical protein